LLLSNLGAFEFLSLFQRNAHSQHHVVKKMTGKKKVLTSLASSLVCRLPNQRVELCLRKAEMQGEAEEEADIDEQVNRSLSSQQV
jgi:hypothetical protein